jgi:glycogen(starch) synthase
MKGNNAIKILMTTDTVGGVWTYSMELCRGLQMHNVEIHLVTMGAKMSEWQKNEADALQNVRVYETDFMLEWMQNPWMDIKECGEWLLKLEETIRPDLVHLNCFAYGCLDFKSPVMVVAHSDVYSWFLSVKKDDPPLEWRDYYWCVKNGLKEADMVIAPSQAMIDAIKSIYSFNGESRVIYNGRCRNIFHQGTKESTVFSMGRLWDEGKNVRLLTDAAAQIQGPVKIAGDNSFDQNSFAVPENVQFLGKLSTGEIAAELSTASVYALPARYEPFGLSPLEAALSGCALVLGDIPSLKEIWQDAAVYVDVHDSDALAEAINGLLADKEQLQFYQSQASMRAKLFSAEAMCEEYFDLYKQLVRQKEMYLKREAV